MTALLTDISPLRKSPPFRRLFAGSLLSTVGGAFTAYAVPLQVYVITHSPVAVGAIGLAELIPTLIVGLLGGSLIDTLDRKKLALVTSVCLAVVSALLAVQAIAGVPSVWLLYGLVAMQAALLAVNAPVRRTSAPICWRPGWRSTGSRSRSR